MDVVQQTSRDFARAMRARMRGRPPKDGKKLVLGCFTSFGFAWKHKRVDRVLYSPEQRKKVLSIQLLKPWLDAPFAVLSLAGEFDASRCFVFLNIGCDFDLDMLCCVSASVVGEPSTSVLPTPLATPALPVAAHANRISQWPRPKRLRTVDFNFDTINLEPVHGFIPSALSSIPTHDVDVSPASISSPLAESDRDSLARTTTGLGKSSVENDDTDATLESDDETMLEHIQHNLDNLVRDTLGTFDEHRMTLC